MDALKTRGRRLPRKKLAGSASQEEQHFHGGAPAAGRKLPGLFFSPGQVATQQLGEASIRLGELGFEPGARLWDHLVVLALEDPRV